MSEKDLACQQVVELVNEYLAHRLTAEKRRAFEAHLETCPPCTSYLQQMKTVLVLASSLGKERTCDVLEPRLLAIFEQWLEKKTD